MRFEDLRVWKAARELTRSVYVTTNENKLSKDFGLKDQMRRAAVSAMSNVAEGYERDGNRELRQFLSVSKGSIGELRSQLYVALDAGYINHQTFEQHVSSCTGISRMLSSLVDSITHAVYKGRKLQ